MTSSFSLPWTTCLQDILLRFPGGEASLVTPFAKYQFTRAGPVWSSALHAWFLLHPHWSTDLSRWSLAAVLALPIPRTADGHHPRGYILNDFVHWNPVTSSYQLTPPATL